MPMISPGGGGTPVNVRNTLHTLASFQYHNDITRDQGMYNPALQGVPGVKSGDVPMHMYCHDGYYYPQRGMRYMNYDQGPIKQTHNPYHAALHTKDGFFQLQGGHYTRDGQWTKWQGHLVHAGTKHPVLSSSGDIINLQDVQDFTLNEKGDIYDDKGAYINTVGVFHVPNIQKDLHTAQGHMFVAPQDNAVPLTEPHMEQGALEQSNMQAFQRLVEVKHKAEQGSTARLMMGKFFHHLRTMCTHYLSKLEG